MGPIGIAKGINITQLIVLFHLNLHLDYQEISQSK